MPWFNDLLLAPVQALNAVRINIWAVALIIAGSVLVLHNHSDVGASLTTGGFALLRSEATPPNTSSPKEGV